MLAAFRSPTPADLECRYCLREMRRTGNLLTCRCGGVCELAAMKHDGRVVTYRSWTAPEAKEQAA